MKKKSNFINFQPSSSDTHTHSDSLLQAKPPGLFNVGNTCYLNSTIQCLTYIKPFREFLQNNHKNCSKKIFCAVCTFQNHIKKTNSKQPFAPTSFSKNIKHIGKHFSHHRQEDAHEFLRFLLDIMVFYEYLL
jgi:ubiquitin carboxyl-terminal hydrolase 36/42